MESGPALADVEVRQGAAQIAFLLKPVSVEQVAATSFAGGVMPQKSTDFYPKLLSGLAIYRVGLGPGTPGHTAARSTMETIQVVLDAKLLKATDLAAKRQKVNRSALIRQALQRHLKCMRELELEEQDRRGYLAHPQREEEFRVWEDAAAWPEL